MNKTAIVFITVMLLTMVSISAQSFNIVGGLNFAKILGSVGFADDINILNNVNGLYLGVNMESSLMEWGSDEGHCLVLGVAFSTKGYGFSFIEVLDDIPVKFEEEVLLYYLEVPVTIKSWINVYNNVDFYFKYGVYLGTAIEGKIKIKASAMGQSESETFDVQWGDNPYEHDFKPYDCGLALGLGFEFGKIITGVSLNYGLNNINPDSQVFLKNKVVTVYAGYSFSKKR
jgi:hypothetical protein